MEDHESFDASVHFSSEALDAVRRRAVLHAELAGKYLRSIMAIPEGEICLPVAALIEFAALLQLAVWECRGVSPNLKNRASFMQRRRTILR